MENWDVSPDRVDMYSEIMVAYPIGDAIITSKCKLNSDNGLLIVSDNGFAWKIKAGFRTSYYDYGKSKWIRWYDVADIIPKKDGQVLVEIKIRKKGELKLDKKGNPKITKWKLTVQQNKDEDKAIWKKREGTFNDIIFEIFKRNEVEKDPPTSDSEM